MANNDRDQTAGTATPRTPSYPLNRVAAAISPSDVEPVIAALIDAGFARDDIMVMTAADVPPLDEPIGGNGWRGFLSRLSLSFGDQLEEIEDAREELRQGHTLILVAVRDEAAQHLAHDVLRMHCGHRMRYFGRWSVRKLEDDLH
jgi:hypothetical protein